MASTHRYLTLDGLRGVAALAVMLFHRRWWAGGHVFEHAYLAVDFFFLLSGFVIAHAYQQRLTSGMTVARFMVARVIRLYPLIIFAAVLGASYALWSAWLQHDSRALHAILLMLPMAMLALPVLPQLNAEPFPLNRPTWSLFNELLVNLLYAVIAPFLSNRVLVALVAISFCVEVATIVHFGSLQTIGSHFESLAAGIPRTIFPFFFGVLLYRLHRSDALPLWRMSFVGLSLVLLVSFVAPPLRSGELVYEVLCIGLIYPAIIVLGSNQQADARLVTVSTILADLSFPIYVLHYPLYELLALTATLAGITEGKPKPWYLLAMSLIVVSMTYVILRSYDVPLRAWLSQRYNARRIA